MVFGQYRRGIAPNLIVGIWLTSYEPSIYWMHSKGMWGLYYMWRKLIFVIWQYPRGINKVFVLNWIQWKLCAQKLNICTFPCTVQYLCCYELYHVPLLSARLLHPAESVATQWRCSWRERACCRGWLPAASDLSGRKRGILRSLRLIINIR